MTHSGWRNPTFGLCRVNTLAKEGDRLAVPKSRAMLAVRRVAPAIGLKPGDVVLLDTLAAFTQAADWEEGTRPVVWPSNDYLIEATGFSRSAVKRRVRKLAELGLIACKDSSNGKRWGRRDDSGRIVEAYGFDLSPLAVRAGEFEARYTSICKERELCKALKHKITILRRTVRAILENILAHALWGVRRQLRERYEALLRDLPRGRCASGKLLNLHDAFVALRDEATAAFEEMKATSGEGRGRTASDATPDENDVRMDPTEVEDGPHIQVTNHLHPVTCNRNEKKIAGTQRATKQPTVDCEVRAAGERTDFTESFRTDAEAMSGESPVDIATIMAACPAFAEMARGIGDYVGSWRELVAVADKIRPMIGISGDAWAEARSAMGERMAAASLALITDKYSEGVVSSPGGYLRGLSRKAGLGDLHLARSVCGRLAER